MKFKCRWCRYASEKRFSLWKHYSLEHSQAIGGVPCCFDDCPQTFNLYATLKSHVSKCHRNTKKRARDNARFSCNHCESIQPTFGDFMTHIRKHTSNNERIECPFRDCDYKTNVGSTFRSHLSRWHSSCCADDLKAEICGRNKNVVGGEELMYDESDEVENDADDLDDEDFRDEVTEGESNDLDCKILHNLALFFLQLQVVSGVPVSAI